MSCILTQRCLNTIQYDSFNGGPGQDVAPYLLMGGGGSLRTYRTPLMAASGQDILYGDLGQDISYGGPRTGHPCGSCRIQDTPCGSLGTGLLMEATGQDTPYGILRIGHPLWRPQETPMETPYRTGHPLWKLQDRTPLMAASG
jgi:hypothetical protein